MTLQYLHELYAYGRMAIAALAIACVFLGLGVFGALFYSWLEVLRARRWPRAVGIIVISKVDVTTMDIGGLGSEPHVSRYPIIEYAFEVGGRQFQSRKIAILPEVEREAEEMVARYPEGASVTVSYHPSNPSNCVIDHHIPRAQQKELIVVTVVAAAIFCLFTFTPASGLLRAIAPGK